MGVGEKGGGAREGGVRVKEGGGSGKRGWGWGEGYREVDTQRSYRQHMRRQE